MLLPALLAILPLLLPAQPELPAGFEQLLSAAGLAFVYPLDSDYRLRNPEENDYFQDQLRLYSRREKIEMRFAIQPETENSWPPHVAAGRLAIHLASNHEEAQISVHRLGEEEAAFYRADWVKMYTFPPKPSFAPFDHCRLLALYREGRGTAFICYLFDDPPPAVLDARLHALYFTLSPD